MLVDHDVVVLTRILALQPELDLGNFLGDVQHLLQLQLHLDLLVQLVFALFVRSVDDHFGMEKVVYRHVVVARVLRGQRVRPEVGLVVHMVDVGLGISPLSCFLVQG